MLSRGEKSEATDETQAASDKSLILTGCFCPQEAYRAIDLSLVFILVGSLALGAALNKTGIPRWPIGWREFLILPGPCS